MGGVLNYDYILELAECLAPSAGARVLDFGCGRGQVVAAGLSRGLDIQGADTFEGTYGDWINQTDEPLRPYIHKIENNILPFGDNSFDLVLSNQVFEHIPDYHQSLREIHRVLKPGGKMIAIFPVRETWYEGHVGLYFPHYLGRWPRLQYLYMYLSRLCGLGLKAPGMSAKEWAKSRQNVIRSVCFYHPLSRFVGDVTSIWQAQPVRHLSAYLRWRIGKHPRLGKYRHVFNAGLLNPLLDMACLRRGGLIFSVEKNR